MTLTAILEFKKGSRLFYNRSTHELNTNGYMPVTTKLEPIDKLDAFVKFLAEVYPNYIHWNINQVQSLWSVFDVGWKPNDN